jgi:uncharacterized membrane protein
MDKKTLSIVGYISIIGWLIAYFSFKDKTDKSSLEKFHLKQGLGLGVLGVANFIIEAIVVSIVPSLYIIFTITGIAIFILWVMGIINASKEEEKPVPLIGGMFVDKFDFIQ